MIGMMIGALLGVLAVSPTARKEAEVIGKGLLKKTKEALGEDEAEPQHKPRPQKSAKRKNATGG